MDEIPSSPRRQWLVWLSAGCILVMLFLAAIFVLVGFGGFFWLRSPAPAAPLAPAATATVARTAPTSAATLTASPLTPVTAEPTPTVHPLSKIQPPATASSRLQPPTTVEQAVADVRAWANLAALWQANFPPHDYYAVAERLGGVSVGPRTIETARYALGDTRTFYVENETVSARLLGISDNIYFWVENDIRVDTATVDDIIAQVENDYYPVLVALFGGEWRPGVDNDPHFSILHLDGFDLAEDIGYFDSVNQYPRTIDDASNEQEIIFMNMGELEWGEALYYGTLVHEMQHMMQWHQDPNETVWLDEALSQLAELRVGLETAESADYLFQTDVRLNSWDYDDDVYAHYAASYLFGVYLWEQLGEDAIRTIAQHPANGLASVRDVLATVRPGTAVETFVGEWAVANWLNNYALDSRFGYTSLALFQPDSAHRVRRVPSTINDSAPQFGVHYIELDYSGAIELAFAGDTLVPFVPTQPHSGEQMWVAPPLNDLNATLTKRFDLSSVSSATLQFWAWYDLERDWDYAYVLVSADNGTTWQPLAGNHSESGIYGPAFNGRSSAVSGNVADWVSEEITLDAYAGREILVRFEVLTDSAQSNGGFAVDDIAVPELGDLADAESDSDGWQADGFVQLGSTLPQQWIVTLISNEATPVVEPIPLDDYNQAVWTGNLPAGGGTLVIMPVTSFTDRDATYWLDIDR